MEKNIKKNINDIKLQKNMKKRKFMQINNENIIKKYKKNCAVFYFFNPFGPGV